MMCIQYIQKKVNFGRIISPFADGAATVSTASIASIGMEARRPRATGPQAVTTARL